MENVWASLIKQTMSNSANLNQMNGYELAAIALFPCLLGLKGMIIKYFPNCLLMNLKDCLRSGKNDGHTFYPFLTPIGLGSLITY